MNHPDPETQKNQDDMLSQLSPERRARYAQLFRIGNASMHYYSNAQSFNPSETDWLEWLEGIPAPVRANLQARGFEVCKTHLPFRRYVLEKNDSGMGEFMRTHLDAEDFAFYQSQSTTLDQSPGDAPL